MAAFGHILFQGINASGQRGLWVTDVAADTHELTGIIGRASSGLNPLALKVLNGEVFFNGTDVTTLGPGTVVGTHELTIAGVQSGGVAGFNPGEFTSATLTIPHANNFTGGNTSDILFRNNSTGDT